MAGYGTSSACPKLLGEDECLRLFQETMSGEKAPDQALTDLAEYSVNVEAE